MDINKCFSFIKICNEKLLNNNEYNIARVLMNNIENIQNVTLEKVSLEANISTASVSRFINKCGFKSFQEYKNCMMAFNNNVKMHRLISHTQRFMRKTNQTLSDQLYDDAINNLQQTKINLNIDLLKQIIQQLKHSQHVIILGDSHELADFYTLQLDLLVNDIPTQLVNIGDKNNSFIHFLNKDDTVLYIDLYNDWFPGQRENILKQIKDKDIFTICFAQEKKHLEDYADILYIYGIENSVNDGYYSLPYLSRLLSELFYHII